MKIEEELIQTNFKREDNGLPSVIFHCIRFMMEKAIEHMGIFRINPSHALLTHYYDIFKAGGDVDLMSVDIDIHLPCGLLKSYFFKNESIFPVLHYNRLIDTIKLEDDEKRLDEIENIIKNCLSPEDLYTLNIVFHLLNLISIKSNMNLMTSKNLAICWSPCIFRDMGQGADVIIYMIDNVNRIFGEIELQKIINNMIEYKQQQSNIVETNDNNLSELVLK